MKSHWYTRIGAVVVAFVAMTTASAIAQDSTSGSSLSLRAPASQYVGGGGGFGYTLSGPYFLRSADPEEPGDYDLRFNYSFEKTDQGDTNVVEFVFEWGIAEDWEFILMAPAVFGEGAVESNGDATFGFHTRLWHEEGLMPAFAVRNLFRLPTGYHGQGIDYTLRGIMTWTLADTTRLHLNPYFSTVSDPRGNEDNFQWAMVIGIDHRVSDDLLLILDYQNGRSSKGDNDQTIEFGGDWQISESETIGFGIDFDLDDFGDDYAFRIGYIIGIGGPQIGG